MTATTTWADYDGGVRGRRGLGRVHDRPRPRREVDPALNDARRRLRRRRARRGGSASSRSIPRSTAPLDELERARGDLGLKGIKLGPNYQVFDPLGDAALRVYELAERHGLPILFHQGASPVREAPLRYAHPLLMDEIAIRFPELRIVMAHLGHPWQRETIVTIRKHPHVYADVSALFYRPWSFYEGLRLATEWGALDKLLFGSDFPIATPAETAAGLRRVNDPIAGTSLPPVPLDADRGADRARPAAAARPRAGPS